MIVAAFKKYFAVLLAVALIVQLLIPFSAIAATSEQEKETNISTEQQNDNQTTEFDADSESEDAELSTGEGYQVEGTDKDSESEKGSISEGANSEEDSLSANTDKNNSSIVTPKAESTLNKTASNINISLSVDGSTTQEYKPGMKVSINAYAPQGEQYKFVWEKNNWADWGVAQEFSDSSTCTWTPTESGTYTIHVDVKDATGKKQTETIKVTLTEDWSFDSIDITPTEASVVKDPATITVNTSGNTDSLQYKFVWEKNNWADWGVAQNASSNATCTWTPTTSGTYTIHVDIIDSTGKKTTKTKAYTVDRKWTFVDGRPQLSANLQKAGEAVEISALTSGENSLLEYKFVWERNNWEEWGIIQNYSTNSSCMWTPTKPGDYNFYVNIKDENGEVVKANSSYKAWEYLGVKTSVSGQKVVINPDLGCTNPDGFRYKYVWEKNNWADWGVVSGWSSKPSATYNVASSGYYSFCVDIQCPDGSVITKSSSSKYISTDPNNGRFQSYSSGTNYLIAVDLSRHKVAVYSGYENNWSILYYWSCVTGAPSTPTITGSFYTTGFKRGSLSTDSRAIYCTQISGGYFFHSILASESELGNSLSHGCIRLSYSAALWIYNNIYTGTRVVIFW